MIRMKALLLLSLLTLTLSCNILLDTDTGVGKPGVDCEELEGETQYILLIGNSYISQNNMPKILKDISCSKGLKTKVFKITKHNFRFLDHDEQEETDYLIGRKKWNFVILQNHGQVPSWNEDQLRDESLPHAKSLADKIYANNSETKIIYMQTWARKDGDQDNCPTSPLVCDFTGHTQALEAGYQIYADETDAVVAHVGSAFELIYKSEDSPVPFNDLWLEDGAHASHVGSYLAAAILFAKITNTTPVGAISAVGLTKVQTFYLQSVAAQTVGPF